MPVCDLCSQNLPNSGAFTPHYIHCLWKKEHPACTCCSERFDGQEELQKHRVNCKK